MPLFQVGYRRYEGERTSHLMRWWPITRTGLTIAWRSKLLRRLVFMSFLPFLYFGWVFFLIGRATDPGGDPSQDILTGVVRGMLGPQVTDLLRDNPGAVRSAVWAGVFSFFGTYFQLLFGALVAAIAGPPLIANDMRTRAFLIYFGRPVSCFDYVIGKTGVVFALMASVTLLPSLLLYTLSILFSPSIDTLVQTAPVAFTMVLSSIAAIVPATMIVLALSSLALQSRFATAAWIAICTMGPLAHLILQQTQGLKGNAWTFLLSLPHSIRALQAGLYDLGTRAEALGLSEQADGLIDGLTSTNSPTLAAIWLGSLSIFSFLLLLRRVEAPTRI